MPDEYPPTWRIIEQLKTRLGHIGSMPASDHWVAEVSSERIHSWVYAWGGDASILIGSEALMLQLYGPALVALPMHKRFRTPISFFQVVDESSKANHKLPKLSAASLACFYNNDKRKLKNENNESQTIT